jgi:DNA-binding response OmpR family regulator
VLLIEDDAEALEAFASVLREELTLWVARDGVHAMEVGEELEWDADALVVDLGLGEGPRGDQFVACWRTREKLPTPVIVASGAGGLSARAGNARGDDSLQAIRRG